MKLLRYGLAIRVFTSKTTLLKNLKLEELVSQLEETCKIPRLALEEVNVTVITMYCRYKQRTIFFHLIQRFALDQNLIRNASGSQVTQSLIAMQIIDLLKTQPTD